MRALISREAKFGHSELQIEPKSLKFAPKLPRNCSETAPKSLPNRSKSLEIARDAQNGSKSLETAQMATKSAQKETLRVVTAAEFLKSSVQWCGMWGGLVLVWHTTFD